MKKEKENQPHATGSRAHTQKTVTYWSTIAKNKTKQRKPKKGSKDRTQSIIEGPD